MALLTEFRRLRKREVAPNQRVLANRLPFPSRNQNDRYSPNPAVERPPAVAGGRSDALAMKKRSLVILALLFVMSLETQANPIVVTDYRFADIALPALLVALLIEAAAVISVLGFWRIWVRCLLFLSVMHAFTIPLVLWLLSENYFDFFWKSNVMFAECIIVLIECLCIFAFAALIAKQRKSIGACLLASFVGNLGSYLAGLLLSGLFA